MSGANSRAKPVDAPARDEKRFNPRTVDVLACPTAGDDLRRAG